MSRNQDETILVINRENEDQEYGAILGRNSPNETKTLDEIYRKIGYGTSQYLCYILVSLVSYVDFGLLVFLTLALPSLRCEWKLSSTFETAISMTFSGSIAFSALTLGTVADKYGRKPVNLWSLILLMLAVTGSAFSPNKWMFLGTMMVTGACIGVNQTCIVIYGVEFAESKYRSICMTLSGVFGSPVVCLTAFFVLRPLGWRWLLIIVTLPAGIISLILIIILPESPWFLSVSGQHKEAKDAVMFIAKVNGKEFNGDIKVSNCQNDEQGSYSLIFNKEHRKATIALSVMWFNNTFFRYGLLFMIPLLFNSHFCGGHITPKLECKQLSEMDLLKISITSIFGVAANVVASILVDKVGRLWPLRITSGLVFVGVASLFICINRFVVFVTVEYLRIVEIGQNITIWIMMPESFPTSAVATGTSFVNGLGQLGGVLGTGCVCFFFYSHPYSVLGVLTVSVFVIFVIALFYDKETKDLALQEAS